MMTTSRERLLAAMRGEQPDRWPVAPWGLGTVALHSAVGQQLLERTDPFIDIGLGCNPVLGADWPLAIRQRGDVYRRRLSLPDRELTMTYRDLGHSSVVTEFACKSGDDLVALLSAPYAAPTLDVDAYEALKGEIGEQGLVILGFGNALNFVHDALGPELCCQLWADEPELLTWATGVAAGRIAGVVARACEAGVGCLRIYGGEYATELMGPRAWQLLIVPHDKPLVDMIHAHGGIAHYHNHGRMARWLEAIAALEVDSLDPIEQPPYGDLSMGEAWRRIGDRVCLVGGLDDMEVLETRTWSEIEPLARELLEAVGKTRFVLGGTSSGLYGERAAHHFVRLVDLVIEYR